MNNTSNEGWLVLMVSLNELGIKAISNNLMWLGDPILVDKYPRLYNNSFNKDDTLLHRGAWNDNIWK